MAVKRSKSISKELGRAELGDARRSRRLEAVAERLIQRPAASLPQALGGSSELEGAYRLLGNEDVGSEQILAPHIDATGERARAAGRICVVSDTTELRFGGDGRSGLGPLQGGGRGFLAHVALAVARDGSRLPLGILAVETITRPEKKKDRRGKKSSRNAADSESRKWSRTALAAAGVLDGSAEIVHVMDREADIFALFAELIAKDQKFVIRVAQNRSVIDDDAETDRLFDAMTSTKAAFFRDVPLSRRKRSTKQHPAREARSASLNVAVTTLTLRRPKTADKALPSEVTLNFVRVFEPNPPLGEAAVEWRLVTTEPIETDQQVESIIDAYRLRWVIEEFFKALKTGCDIEASQLESAHSLRNLLAIKLPIAAQLLALRSQAESNEDALAAGLLSPAQLKILNAMSKKKLPPRPTASAALFAIAALGGHIKNNGWPGWLVIWRGFDDLLRYETAWAAFKAQDEM